MGDRAGLRPRSVRPQHLLPTGCNGTPGAILTRDPAVKKLTRIPASSRKQVSVWTRSVGLKMKISRMAALSTFSHDLAVERSLPLFLCAPLQCPLVLELALSLDRLRDFTAALPPCLPGTRPVLLSE